jgi:hypothetical protein
MNKYEFDEEAYEKEINSDTFKHGLDIGESIGEFRTYESAQKAFDRGEIELWLDYYRPKSLEDWDKWYEEHGSHEDMRNRWRAE